VGGLGGDVEGQKGEGDGDDAQSAAIAGIAGGALELPDDDSGGDDLDDRIHAEAGQGERPHGCGGGEQNEAADDVPGQGGVFQPHRPRRRSCCRVAVASELMGQRIPARRRITRRDDIDRSVGRRIGLSNGGLRSRRGDSALLRAVVSRRASVVRGGLVWSG
jgi:hypothetical protein